MTEEHLPTIVATSINVERFRDTVKETYDHWFAQHGSKTVAQTVERRLDEALSNMIGQTLGIFKKQDGTWSFDWSGLTPLAVELRKLLEQSAEKWIADHAHEFVAHLSPEDKAEVVASYELALKSYAIREADRVAAQHAQDMVRGLTGGAATNP